MWAVDGSDLRFVIDGLEEVAAVGEVSRHA